MKSQLSDGRNSNYNLPEDCLTRSNQRPNHMPFQSMDRLKIMKEQERKVDMPGVKHRVFGINYQKL